MLILLAVALPIGGFYLAQPDALATRILELEGELKKTTAELVRLRADRETETERQASSQVNEPAGPQRRMPAQAPQPEENAPASMSYRMSKMEERFLDKTYASLFQMLGLNEEELAYFKQLLHDRKYRRLDLISEMTEPGLTSDQKAAKTRELTRLNQSLDETIRHFLNHEEDFATFKNWEDTRGERQQIETARPIFQAEGVPLTPSQEEELLKLMIAVRSEKLAERPIEGMEGRELKHSHRTQMRKEAEKRRIQELAPRFLNPAQVEALKKSGIGLAP